MHRTWRPNDKMAAGTCAILWLGGAAVDLHRLIKLVLKLVLMLIIYIMWGVSFTLVDIRILNIFYFLIDNDAVRVFLCFIYRGD